MTIPTGTRVGANAFIDASMKKDDRVKSSEGTTGVSHPSIRGSSGGPSCLTSERALSPNGFRRPCTLSELRSWETQAQGRQ